MKIIARRVLTVSAALALAGLLAACSSTEKAADSKAATTPSTKVNASAPMNTNCPYSNKPVNNSVTRSYKGATVGFCCSGCAGKWDKATDADRDAMVAKK